MKWERHVARFAQMRSAHINLVVTSEVKKYLLDI